MVSLGVMVYLVARAIPRVEDGELFEEKNKRTRSTPISIFLERADKLISSATEKALRRARVLILKIESAISRSIEKKRKLEGESSGKVKQNSALFEKKSENEL